MDLVLNNLQILICHETQITNQLPFRVRVDRGIIAMEAYSTFPTAVEHEHHHQITLWGGSYSSAEMCSAYITALTDKEKIFQFPNLT